MRLSIRNKDANAIGKERALGTGLFQGSPQCPHTPFDVTLILTPSTMPTPRYTPKHLSQFILSG